jgi:DNA-binding NarL/FixJ family response regulator
MQRKNHWSGFDRSGLTSAQRDAEIVRLHKAGWTRRRIAARLGMSQGGITYALERIAEGRPGNDPRR